MVSYSSVLFSALETRNPETQIIQILKKKNKQIRFATSKEVITFSFGQYELTLTCVQTFSYK